MVLGYCGWDRSNGLLRFLVAIGIPVFAASVWGVFAVPDDPGRSGRAPIPAHGYLRLTLEFVFFGLAVWALSNLVSTWISWFLGGVIFLRYVISYDRTLWLLGRKSSNG
jgi:hypothetical protein